MTKIYSLLLILCLGLNSVCLHTHVQEAAPEAANLGDIDQFQEDSYNYFESQNGNIVWAGALTLAWKELKSNIIGEDIQVNSDSEIVQKIVENFNGSPFSTDDLSEEDFYVKSGYGQSTVDTINSEVREKFPQKSTPDLNVDLADQDIISYAYLAKKFQYPTQFSKLEYFDFKNETVKGFKASSDEQRRQVQSFYYSGRNEFMVKVLTDKEGEGVYLLRTDYKTAKVSEIIEHVATWEKQPTNSIAYDEPFMMPVLDLDYYRDVSQLAGLQVENEDFQDYVIAKAFEALKLKMDEKGVTVENEGGIIMVGSAMPISEPNRYIFDDTFWIVLKQEGKHPYLCAKINSPVEKQEM